METKLKTKSDWLSLIFQPSQPTKLSEKISVRFKTNKTKPHSSDYLHYLTVWVWIRTVRSEFGLIQPKSVMDVSV